MITLHPIAGAVVDGAFLNPHDELGDGFVLQQFLDGVEVAGELGLGQQRMDFAVPPFSFGVR